jgi:hypothetical protein
MPIDLKDLLETAVRAGAGFPGNVRSGKFIKEFEGYCARELGRVKLPPIPFPVGPFSREKVEFHLDQGTYVLGGYYAKEVDVVLTADHSGPLMGISLKSIMRSISNNVNNRWEETVGDAANLHSRFPMLALGYLMIVPYAGYQDSATKKLEYIIDSYGVPTALARNLERKLRSLQGRDDSTDLPSYFEEVALCVLDMDPKAPKLHPSFPSKDLHVNSFFDRLVKRFRDRNSFLPTEAPKQTLLSFLKVVDRSSGRRKKPK